MDSHTVLEPAPHIRIEGLTVAYEKPKAAGKLVAVSNADLQIARGKEYKAAGTRPEGAGR